MSQFIKQLSVDTRQEIEKTEKYLKDLKKFQIVINPRTAPRKKHKKQKAKMFLVTKNLNMIPNETINTINTTLTA